MAVYRHYIFVGKYLELKYCSFRIVFTSISLTPWRFSLEWNHGCSEVILPLATKVRKQQSESSLSCILHRLQISIYTKEMLNTDAPIELLHQKGERKCTEMERMRDGTNARWVAAGSAKWRNFYRLSCSPWSQVSLIEFCLLYQTFPRQHSMGYFGEMFS